jgi:hypothetical protein
VLPTKLSQLLVAFTIECDNTFEHRMPHRTTLDTGGHGPWLISMVMWANYLRLVPPEGLPLHGLEGPTGVPKLSGLQRWGYLSVQADAADPRPVPSAKDWLVTPTRSGLEAQRLWRPIAAEVEQRWRDRFGSGTIDGLRKALLALTSQLPQGLPRFMPVLGYGLTDNVGAPFPGPPDDDPDLSVLLSHALIAWTQDFEADSPVSLALGANVLRLIDDGEPLGSLPLRGGVSKEAVAMAVAFLESAGLAETSGKPRLIRLTSKGSQAKQRYEARLSHLSEQWRTAYGAQVLNDLMATVDVLAQQPEALTAGLVPYPGAWRSVKPYRYQTDAVLADPFAALPHHPMVLHRGGYPDGS